MALPSDADRVETCIRRGTSLIKRLQAREYTAPATSSYEATMTELESTFEWRTKEESYVPGTDSYDNLNEDDLTVLDIPKGLRWHQWHGWETKLTAEGHLLFSMQRAELCVLMCAEEGIIVVQVAMSPSSRQGEFSLSMVDAVYLTPQLYHDANIECLVNCNLHISDLMYLVWNRYCQERNIDPRRLKNIIRHNVYNSESLLCISTVWDWANSQGNEEASTITYATYSREGLMLLGCPNGLAGAHLLLTHGDVFHSKTVTKVDCIKVMEEGLESMSVLKYWIEDS